MPKKISANDIENSRYVFFLFGPHRLKIGIIDKLNSTFPDAISIEIVDDERGFRTTGKTVKSTSRVLRLIDESEFDKVRKLRNLI